MRNPWQQIKRLPWLPLFQIAGFTVLVIFVLEILLVLGSTVPLLRRSLLLLFTPPLSMVITLSVAIGAGAVAVYLLERFRRDIYITTGVLWALVACLLLMSFVRELSPVPSLLSTGQTSLIGIVLGVFWRGRRYWRY